MCDVRNFRRVYDKFIFNTKARRDEDTKFSFILCDLCGYPLRLCGKKNARAQRFYARNAKICCSVDAICHTPIINDIKICVICVLNYRVSHIVKKSYLCSIEI